MIIDIYVDGSYFKNEPNIVRGAFVIINRETNKPAIMCRTSSRKEMFISANNVGGEVLSAMLGIMFSRRLVRSGELNINVYHDYIGIREFITGKWKAKTAGMIYYSNMIGNFLRDNPDVKLYFHKVKAHSGNKFNELADTIAKGIIPIGYSKEDIEDIEL